MLLKLARRLLFETDKRLLWKLVYLMGLKGMLSLERHRRRLRRGQFFPPFLYVSVTNSCNLRCQGCWVDVSHPRQTLSLEALDRLVREAREMGNAFFGIVGGEPFLHPELLVFFARHRDAYFQVFTNGQLITDRVARELRRLGNVSPLISIEGGEVTSDERRGRAGVLGRTLEGLHNCLRHRLLTGVCTSVCQSNIDELLAEEWIDRLIELGVLYTWFHVYRPVGPSPCPELALSPEEQRRVRRFVVEMRARKPILIIDAYHDHLGRALCPAVTGVSHHISPWGDIEPCPIIQFAAESIHDPDRTLGETFLRSRFLRDFRRLAASTTRGCIVLERPDLLKKLVLEHGARDSTARRTALQELEALEARPSQYDPEHEIPEKSWIYRLLKRRWFNDFGVYDGLDPGARGTPEPEGLRDSAGLWR